MEALRRELVAGLAGREGHRGIMVAMGLNPGVVEVVEVERQPTVVLVD